MIFISFSFIKPDKYYENSSHMFLEKYSCIEYISKYAVFKSAELS